jgi:hypothetical protein
MKLGSTQEMESLLFYELFILWLQVSFGRLDSLLGGGDRGLYRQVVVSSNVIELYAEVKCKIITT